MKIEWTMTINAGTDKAATFGDSITIEDPAPSPRLIGQAGTILTVQIGETLERELPGIDHDKDPPSIRMRKRGQNVPQALVDAEAEILKGRPWPG